MLALVLATVCSTGFGLVVRRAQGRGSNLWLVGVTNYIVACAFHLVRHVSQGGNLAVHPTTVALGAVVGVAYAASFAATLPTMRMRGVSISTAVARLSVVIPILVAVLCWGERPNGAQVGGSLLALTAMPFLGIQCGSGPVRIERRQVRWMVALFFLSGISSLGIRTFDEFGAASETSAFLATLFGTGGVVIACLLIWGVLHGKARALELGAVGEGCVLGLLNAGSNLALITALRQIPSVLVFPFQGAVSLVLSCLAARLLWGERISRLEAVGMSIAVVSVIFINLR
jgi:drug/metabolite transporter (DMT)-like permease